MSKLRAALGGVRRAVRPRRYYAEPRSYWEQRHETFGTSLEGIGRLGLSEAENQIAYEAKWAQVGPLVAGLGEPGRLLDAGCGIGWFTRRFLAAGWDVAAFDFTQAGIDVAREQVEGPVAWSVADLASFRADHPLDVVVCIDVLFHVVDDDTWAASVRNLRDLARGGHLVIQDHLVPEAEVTEPGPAGTFHTRWRSRDRYVGLLADSELVAHVPYEVAAEGATKDLLVFAVPPDA